MRFSRIWRRAGNARHFDEEGFTLIELTISIVILTIVIGSITLALVTVLTLSSTASKSISDSSDAQVVSASLTNDVQTAAGITTSPTVSKCGTPTGTQLLGLEWDRVAGSSPTTFNPKSEGDKFNFDTIVSYLAVQRGTTWVLIRDECKSGYSSTPTSSETVSSDICGPSEKGCTRPQQPPTITPATKATAATTGWTSAAGIAGVSFTIAEPQSHYSYTLEASPAVAGGSGAVTTVTPPTTACEYATPDPNSVYAQTLCFVNFQTYNYTKAKYTSAHPTRCGETFTESISGTPFKLSFCLQVRAGTESDDEAPPTDWSTSPTASAACSKTPGYVQTPKGVAQPVNAPADPCADPSSADIVAAPFPTYANPPTSESFLGDNGFYTGVPDDPALYEYLEGTAATLYFTDIKVHGPNGPATKWDLVTGDAESTDPGESLTWSTCGAVSGAIQTSTTCVGTSSPPKFSLIPNRPPTPNNPLTPVDYYGNACMNTKYTNSQTSWLRYGALAPGDSFSDGGGTVFMPTKPTQAQEVECVAGVSSDKTGTVMLEAPRPTKLTVNMVGTGLQGIFLGFLL